MTRSFKSSEQTIAYLPCGDDDLFAVLARPTTEPNGVTVFQLWGYSVGASSGFNQFRSRLTAALAERGYHVLRIDYRGGGESTGEFPAPDLDEPALDEARVGLQWLAEQGLGRIVLMGTCFGTRIALHIADDIPDLHGVVFMDPPTGNLDKTWYRAGSVSLGAIAKRLARAPRATLRDPVVRLTLKDKLRGRRSRSDAPEETAVSAAFLEPFEKLVTRRVPVLVCQGPFDVFRKEWVGATRGPLRHVLEHDFVEFHEVPDRAVPPTLTSQEELIDVVTNWMPPTQTHPGSTGRSA